MRDRSEFLAQRQEALFFSSRLLAFSGDRVQIDGQAVSENVARYQRGEETWTVWFPQYSDDGAIFLTKEDGVDKITYSYSREGQIQATEYPTDGETFEDGTYLKVREIYLEEYDLLETVVADLRNISSEE